MLHTYPVSLSLCFRFVCYVSIRSVAVLNAFRFAGSASNSSSQYGNFSASAKLKDAATGGAATHYDR